MYFLGISGFFHDSAVALVRDGTLLGCVEEERFNREKHTGAFPEQALTSLLGAHGLDVSDLDEVGVYCRPFGIIAAARSARFATCRTRSKSSRPGIPARR